MGFLRSLVFALLLLVFFGVTLAANVGSWALRSVLDTSTFVQTAAAVLDTPAVEAYVADKIGARLVQEILSPDGSVSSQIAQALGLSAGASEAQVTAAVDAVVLAVLSDSELADIRDEAIRQLHAEVKDVALGSGGAAGTGDTLTLDLDALIAKIDERLDPGSPGTLFGEPIPTDLGQVDVVSASTLRTVSLAVRTADTLQWFLPVVAILVGLVALVVARRRFNALAWLGTIVMVVGVICMVVVVGASTAVGSVAVTDLAARDAVQHALESFTHELQRQSAAVIVIGVALLVVGVLGGWLTGRESRPAAPRPA